MKRTIAIVACGKSKQAHPCTAGEMYTGHYHRKNLLLAQELFGGVNWTFILSAFYGLLSLDEQIEPYDMRLGDPHCVDIRTVLLQAIKFDLLDCDVWVFGGKQYREFVRQIWPDCKALLADAGGIGCQMREADRILKKTKG